MNTLLRIDSSIRLEDSYSRTLGDYFVHLWTTKHTNSSVIQRDTVTQPVPHLTQQTFAAFYDDRFYPGYLHLSDVWIDELYRCTEILILCPMYNYGIPSALKAYFDHVIRTEKTFTSDNGIKGLLSNKKAHIITVSGGIHSIEGRNPMENHLTCILNHLGITDINYFPLEGIALSDQTSAKTDLVKTQINKYLNFS
ncbi:hypothetical protein ACM46_15045 [Chryseobacterium angstadtii]|uniref:FMN dependent NADH:quinone oxidoreductase n=1 Tax=Chryseobacterium angstadtii TaxID=558151 RepID=A0A0J7I5Z0_9FLAO|nr:NAD(P)H-dependent oxidoreductase [Chryseobacterium angstadtii]KMQ61349.1 hypothetical protein ACM46_15045 [Chryseobacterium angstadtii]